MCTTVIVGKAVSKTGRVIVGHNEDAGGRSLHQSFFYPAADHAPGEMLTAEPGCARLPQAPHTLGVYWSNMLAPAPGSSFDQGFANDAGLVLCSNAGGTAFDAESTDLTDGGVGFLFRRVIAERARTAREAVEIARDLVTRYGYAGEARNYTVADKDEAWCINVVRGRHFVAKRLPDDRVMLISNMLAIRSVDLSDKANVVASPDLSNTPLPRDAIRPHRKGALTTSTSPAPIRATKTAAIRKNRSACAKAGLKSPASGAPTSSTIRKRSPPRRRWALRR